MKRLFFLVSILLIIGAVSCNKENTVRGETQTRKEASKTLNNNFQGVVLSTQDASRYTYIEYKTPDGRVMWAAVLKTDLKKGDRITLLNPQPMRNFESKSLKKHFDVIYFAEGVRVNGKSTAMNPHNSMKMPDDGFHKGKNPHISQDIAKIDTSNVKKLEGGLTIADILKNPEKYNGKIVKFRGVVVKFLPDIMKTNWAHLKDSSTDKDITITTNERLKVGEIVSIEGKLEINKDFGYGYFYPVIIENAKRIK